MAFTLHSTSAYGQTPREDFALTTLSFGPIAAAALADGDYPLFIMPFHGDIEKVIMTWSTAAASGSDTVAIHKNTGSGTTLSGGTVVYTAAALNGTAGVAWEMGAASDAVRQNIPAGTRIGLVTAGGISALAGLCVTVVLRKGPYLTDGGSNRQYLSTKA